MELRVKLGGVAGRSLSDFYALVHRYDSRFGNDPATSETWVVRVAGRERSILLARAGWLNGLYLSPAGHVYVTDVAGRVYVAGEIIPGLDPWQTFELAGNLRGIFGLDDAHVWVWGKHRGEDVLYRWDGTRFSAVASPGPILAMHGVAPRALHAVGERGLLARWDGARWHLPAEPVTDAALWSVHATSEARAVACGPRAKLLAFESEDGWRSLGDMAWDPTCVTSWYGITYVGAGMGGLFRIAGDYVERPDLVRVDAGIDVRGFDPRESLLGFTPDLVVGSEQGVSFRRIPAAMLAALGESIPPRFPVLPEEEPDEGDEDFPDLEVEM